MKEQKIKEKELNKESFEKTWYKVAKELGIIELVNPYKGWHKKLITIDSKVVN